LHVLKESRVDLVESDLSERSPACVRHGASS
jgi:hypothetical protein